MRKHKILATALAALTLTAAAIGLTSCTLPDPHVIFPYLYGSTEGGDSDPSGETPSTGKESAATITGYYTSNKNIYWQNMLPTYNYYFMVITEQSIETFDDMTYCYTVSAQMFSNVHYGPDYYPNAENAENLATSNEQPHIITRYYGTYTEVETKKSSITISLGTPTRVFYAKQGGAYYDTANWTDKMSSDLGMTADEFLKSKIVVEVSVYNEEMTEIVSTTEKELFPASGVEVYIKTTGCSFEALEDFIVTYIG